MEKLIVPSVGLGQTLCAAEALSRQWLLWPGAEDGALRGRNLSAVFRTLYRQVGKPQKRLPSCAQTWRVENQCDKSTLRTFQRHRLIRERGPKKPFHPTLKQPLTRQSNCVSIFSGQAQSVTGRDGWTGDGLQRRRTQSLQPLSFPFPVLAPRPIIARQI